MCAGSALQNCKSQSQLRDKIMFQNRIVAYMFLSSGGAEIFTYGDNSEDCVHHSNANGCVNWLVNSSSLENVCRVVKDLSKYIRMKD